MTSIALALHALAAVIWVGGMFTIYVCLRPALGVLETPSDRVRIAAATFGKFFPWVWLSILVLFATGYLMVFTTQGGFAQTGMHVHIMQTIAWVMVGLFAFLYWGAWKDLRAAVSAQDWPAGASSIGRIRRIIAVNLPFGLIVVAIGASGRWWI